ETLQANSILPSTSSLMILPAFLATNISPIPLSKTSSTGMRLSRQDNTTDFGNWAEAVAITSFEWSLAVILFSVNLLLPAFRRCKIVSGESAFNSSAEVIGPGVGFTATFCIGLSDSFPLQQIFTIEMTSTIL